MKLLRTEDKKIIILYMSIHKITNSNLTVTRAKGKTTVTTQQEEHRTIVAQYFEQIMKRCKKSMYVIYVSH
jgi:hypothetical protein